MTGLQFSVPVPYGKGIQV